jgi:hypothetical protein
MSDSPTRTVSLTTSHTHVPIVQGDKHDIPSPQLPSSGGAIPDDMIEDKIEDKDDHDDWEHDPVNPRNWSPAKKWIATTLVS